MSNLLSGYGDPNSIFSLFEKRKKKVQNLEKLSGGRALCLTTPLTPNKTLEQRNAPRTPLKEISMSPDPNDTTYQTSPEQIPTETPLALTKRTGDCPNCHLPYNYDHVAWCRGLSDGYTCRCHKKTPIDIPTSPTPTISETDRDPNEIPPFKAP